MKYDIVSLQLEHEDLVTLFSTALYGDSTFSHWVPEKFEALKTQGEGDCIEDHYANVLMNGGYICIADMEAAGETEEDCDNNSDILKVEEYEEFNGFMGNTFVAPVYHLNLERINQAITEIMAKKTTGKYSSGLQKSLMAVLDPDDGGDYYDAWNVLQYFIFGDVVYG